MSLFAEKDERNRPGRGRAHTASHFDSMGRKKQSKIKAEHAIKARYDKWKTRSQRKGAPQAGAYGGASDASFLAPVAPDKVDGRLSPPPKHFDPSSPPKKRKRRESLSPSPTPRAKCDLSPSPLPISSSSGLIWRFWPKLGKMRLMNSNKRLLRRRRGHLSARRFSSPRRPRRSLR